MCRSKSVGTVSAQNTDYEFPDTITSLHVDIAEAGGKPWMDHIQMIN